MRHLRKEEKTQNIHKRGDLGYFFFARRNHFFPVYLLERE